MILLLHILIALSSIVYTTFVFFSPSVSGLNKANILVALTIASGTALVFTQPATLTRACITGLVYIGIMGVAIAITRHKLAITDAQKASKI